MVGEHVAVTGEALDDAADQVGAKPEAEYGDPDEHEREGSRVWASLRFGGSGWPIHAPFWVPSILEYAAGALTQLQAQGLRPE
jgi:hypothetical protein